jgi:hypothetical protein
MESGDAFADADASESTSAISSAFQSTVGIIKELDFDAAVQSKNGVEVISEYGFKIMAAAHERMF